jgi:hypothetical protein
MFTAQAPTFDGCVVPVIDRQIQSAYASGMVNGDRRMRGEAEPASYGPIYTTGQSFRARAEARQRWFRAEHLGVGWTEHGHWLDERAEAAGANFASPIAFNAATMRDRHGKGVGKRTFQNMLSSQAMAFNIFAPLANDLSLATEALLPFVPNLTTIRAITLEYTPAASVFRDQSGRGGVDCDVLIDATVSGDVLAVIVIETKFVETELSTCSFRKTKKANQALKRCPDDVRVASSRQACAYSAKKKYAYWDQSDALGTLVPLQTTGCPFSGPAWQLWVNHTLAHAEAVLRGASEAILLLCAPEGNDVLLRGGTILSSFRQCLSEPESARRLPLDSLLNAIASATSADQREWVETLRLRYANI